MRHRDVLLSLVNEIIQQDFRIQTSVDLTTDEIFTMMYVFCPSSMILLQILDSNTVI